MQNLRSFVWLFFFYFSCQHKISVNVRSVKVSVNSISKVSLCCRLDDFICKQCWVSMSTVLWAVRGLLLFAFSTYSQDEVNVIVIHIRWGHVLYLSVSLQTIQLHPFFQEVLSLHYHTKIPVSASPRVSFKEERFINGIQIACSNNISSAEMWQEAASSLCSPVNQLWCFGEPVISFSTGLVWFHQGSDETALHGRPVRADAEDFQRVCSAAGFPRRVFVHESPAAAQHRSDFSPQTLSLVEVDAAVMQLLHKPLD